MIYVIIDRRDNTFYCGQTGWSKLEENAIWYSDDPSICLYNVSDMQPIISALNAEHGDHFYAAMLPIEAE